MCVCGESFKYVGVIKLTIYELDGGGYCRQCGAVSDEVLR